MKVRTDETEKDEKPVMSLKGNRTAGLKTQMPPGARQET